MSFDDPKENQEKEIDPMADIEAQENDFDAAIGNDIAADEPGESAPQELSEDEEIYEDDDLDDDGLGYGHEDESNEPNPLQ